MPRINPPTGDPILDALRRERERRGWSQQRLANEIGRATYQTIFNWESGTNEPTLSSLREWAGALGVDIALTLRPPASGGVVEPSPQAVEEATHESFTELRCDREQGPHPRHTWSHKGEPCEGHVCPGERLPASLTRQPDPGALMEEPDRVSLDDLTDRALFGLGDLAWPAEQAEGSDRGQS